MIFNEKCMFEECNRDKIQLRICHDSILIVVLPTLMLIVNLIGYYYSEAIHLMIWLSELCMVSYIILLLLNVKFGIIKYDRVILCVVSILVGYVVSKLFWYVALSLDSLTVTSVVGAAYLITNTSLLTQSVISWFVLCILLVTYYNSSNNIAIRMDIIGITALFLTLFIYLLVIANTLFALLFHIEIFVLSIYAMLYFLNPLPKHLLKYFFYNVVFSFVLFVGLVSMYIGVGGTVFVPFSTLYVILTEILTNNNNFSSALFFVHLGVLLLYSGLFGKLGVLPFFIWQPGTYSYFSFISLLIIFILTKPILFLMVIKLSTVVFMDIFLWDKFIRGFVYGVALLSMIVGAIGSINQSSIRYLLVYSSVNHFGFLLFGLLAFCNVARMSGINKVFEINFFNVSCNIDGLVGVYLYLLIYVVSMLLFILCVCFLRLNRDDKRQYSYVSDYVGLFNSNKVVAILVIVAIFSLAGLPPFVGFFGKWWILSSCIVVFGVSIMGWIGAVVALVTSVILAIAYFRLISNILINENVSTHISKIEFFNSQKHYYHNNNGGGLLYALVGLIYNLIPIWCCLFLCLLPAFFISDFLYDCLLNYVISTLFEGYLLMVDFNSKINCKLIEDDFSLVELTKVIHLLSKKV